MTIIAAPPAAPPTPSRPVAEHPKPKPAHTGVLVGIATITMSFAALTSALVVRQGASPDWQHFRLPPILYFNTLMLVASSLTIETSRRRPSRALSWIYVTLALGLTFVVGQVLAWRNLAAQGLFLATSASSAFFYLFTALHGLHVLGGLVALLYVRHRLRSDALAASTALGAAALYWHFMAVLWIYLLSLLALRI